MPNGTDRPDRSEPLAAKTIAVVTSSRADYGHLYWPLRELQAHRDIEPSIIAMAAHLSPQYGNTLEQIRADGFTVADCVECLLNSDSDLGMAKSLGLATLGMADALARLRPDLLLLIADRYEMLAPASAALTLRIPIAHIEGGEVSLGAIDDTVRNALTKMSHLHFTPTVTATRRVIALGEEPWRVHRVGAPSLDHLRRSTLPNRTELETAVGTALKSPLLVVAYHPVTMHTDTTDEAEALFGSLREVDGQLHLCFPNADAGSHRLIARARELAGLRADTHIHVNLPHLAYWALLKTADLLVGNSSSGIMESPALGLPTVNIGARQQGRERASNIIDALPRREAIIAAVARARTKAFRQSAAGVVNPYGDGAAGEKIARILAATPIDQRLLIKRPAPLTP